MAYLPTDFQQGTTIPLKSAVTATSAPVQAAPKPIVAPAPAPTVTKTDPAAIQRALTTTETAPANGTVKGTEVYHNGSWMPDEDYYAAQAAGTLPTAQSYPTLDAANARGERPVDVPAETWSYMSDAQKEEFLKSYKGTFAKGTTAPVNTDNFRPAGITDAQWYAMPKGDREAYLNANPTVTLENFGQPGEGSTSGYLGGEGTTYIPRPSNIPADAWATMSDNDKAKWIVWAKNNATSSGITFVGANGETVDQSTVRVNPYTDARGVATDVYDPNDPLYGQHGITSADITTSGIEKGLPGQVSTSYEIANNTPGDTGQTNVSGNLGGQPNPIETRQEVGINTLLQPVAPSVSKPLMPPSTASQKPATGTGIGNRDAIERALKGSNKLYDSMAVNAQRQSSQARQMSDRSLQERLAKGGIGVGSGQLEKLQRLNDVAANQDLAGRLANIDTQQMADAQQFELKNLQNELDMGRLNFTNILNQQNETRKTHLTNLFQQGKLAATNGTGESYESLIAKGYTPDEAEAYTSGVSGLSMDNYNRMIDRSNDAFKTSIMGVDFEKPDWMNALKDILKQYQVTVGA